MATINLATVRIKLTADNEEYKERIQQSRKQTEDHGKVFGTAIAGAAAGAFAIATKAVIDYTRQANAEFKAFDRQAREVFTLLPDMSVQATEAMRADIMEFSGEVGRLTDETVPALYQAISAGVPSDTVFDFMETASDAALGGVTTLETAVDGISSVINAYGQDVIGAGEASDLMFAAVRGGKTTFEELSRSLFNVIPVASSLNLEFGNVTAALAAMTAQGTPTSVATTQLRQLLVELSKEGSKTAATFERLAGESFASFIARGGNLQQALAIMEEGAAAADLRLSDMFGSVEAGQAALALTGAGAAKFASELDAAAAAQGATAEAAAIMSDSLEHQEALASAAKEQLLLLIGEALEPAQRKWLELQRVIAETGASYIKEDRARQESYRGGADYIAQMETLTDDFYMVQDAIIAVNSAYDPLSSDLEVAAANTETLRIATELLAGGFAGTGDELADLALEIQTAQKRLENVTNTAVAYYVGMAGVEAKTDDVTESTNRLAQAEQLHAIDIARGTAEYEANQQAIEDNTLARVEFIEQFEEMTAVVNSARGPVEDLVLAQDELTASQGEWVTTYMDTSDQVAGLSQQLAYDLSDDQKAAYRDIMRTVEEGSAEWLSAYDALQNDLTDSQRASLVAQIADLQASNGQVVNAYTGNAAAAEAAQARIDAANAAIALSYRQAALDIALMKISEQYGEDALAAQEAFLKIQVGIGTLSQEEANKLLEVAEKTDAITKATGLMMDKYLEDGVLMADEAENIANMVGLMEENSTRSEESIIRLAEMGYSSLEELRGGADLTAEGFGVATDSVETLEGMLLRLPDNVTVDIITNYTSTGTPPPDSVAPPPASPPSDAGDYGQYATGGFTGFGDSTEVAGIVHRGEFVFSAESVNNIGLDTLEAFHSIGQDGGSPTAVGGGDTYNIYTQDRSDEAVRNMNQWARQRELARGFAGG